MLGLIGSIIAT